MSSTPIHRGLAGVIADTTDICDVTADGSSLTYRGYLVDELAAFRTFVEVAYLLWHGELPDADALGRFRTAERSRREVSRTLISLIDQLSGTCHAMDVMRTAVSLLGAEDPRQAGAGDDFRPVELFARVPVIVAHDYRRRRGLDRIPPCPELGYIENFFQMCFGQIPSPEAIECFELSMILYAEHSFNASTFSARVVASTGSDIYSAVTAAVGALKGPLHGGANEAVMRMMLAIGDPGRAGAWVRQRLTAGRKVAGFGHRVYKQADSRVATMKSAFLTMAKLAGGERWADMYEAIEETMLAEKGIYPNLDFPASPAYYLMGFDIAMFTPLFVMARITGWLAHIAEQRAAGTLIRPLSAYTGHERRSVPRSPRSA